jgi:hypothetical protein
MPVIASRRLVKAGAIAASLADDAQFITVNGAWTTSRQGFRDLMQRLHGPDGPYRTSARRSPADRSPPQSL